MIRGELRTGGAPLYLEARLIAGGGFRTELYDHPPWLPDEQLVAAELTPYLRRLRKQGIGCGLDAAAAAAVINHPAFTIEPWCLRTTELELDVLAQAESLFALSNGHIGWRGNLDEGEPAGLPGCYLNGFYEVRPLPYAEAAYGFPEAGQTMINVTNGKVIRLLVNDEPFDIRYGTLRAHERCLDFRTGTLHRTAEWVSPSGRAVRVTSTRLVSLAQRAIAAVCYEVEAIDGQVRVVVQSELIANEPLPPRSDDPRVAAVLEAPLVWEADAAAGARAGLVHSTRRSKLRIAAVMDHEVEGPADTEIEAESFPHLGRVMVSATLEPGERLRLVKFVAYGWSAVRSVPAVRDQADAALAGAKHTGWEGLLAGQQITWTSSGSAPTSRSTGMPSSSRPYGLRCSTCCRPVPAPRAGRSGRRG